ncbi:MAG: hypothetical protein KKC68_07020 [Candidatus Thermoplasmatota archaeon]|nr:hypothetical protein [Candidatus Thermoplasmatota archaeon]MBU1941511.1 hypothetical protein [Candidatus Thermoplasmatota archaeon]
MDPKLTVELIFLFSAIIMIYLLIRRPFLSIRLGVRNIKIETYLLGALISPFILLIFGLLTYSQILQSLQGTPTLNPLGILTLFFSMVFMSIYLDITGFFEYCARLSIKYAGLSGIKLFISLYLIISLLTIFTSNDIIILTFTPFIYYFAKHTGLDPLPYLITEFFAANTWSMMLYIGNPTNIVLAVAFNIDFIQFLRWMILPTITAGLLNLLLLYLIFRKQLRKPINHIETIDPITALTDKKGAIIGIFLISSCILTLALAPLINLPLWIIALTFALTLLLILLVRDIYHRYRHHATTHVPITLKTFKRIPLGIIPFILAMFITVEALRFYGITHSIGTYFSTLIGSSKPLAVYLYGITSAATANILNNIPMTIAYVPIITAQTHTSLLPAIFATTIGSNLGANLTPLGALAGIMWIGILKNKAYPLSFKDFVRYGLIITPITLLICLSVLAIEFSLF